VKVSVVVPVYNPGKHIEPLVESLLRQTMPADEFEAIFVDDGSTDSTPARLDQLAAEHPHFSVVHQENSGWPGKPRNVGTDLARGEYVFFSDNDDWFGDEALERLYDAAIRHDADIVIGKMVGHNRGVPRELFRKNRENASFANAPLQDSLTPHKLFRRSFLVEHGIRFPEGKRRLEDHVFVMQAYFAAKSIYVLSDYDCYHHIRRGDESNAGFDDIEPVSYYGYVRESVDIVLANTERGEVQDRCLRRFLRVEILARLEGGPFLNANQQRQRVLFDAARALVVETMPPTVEAGLPGRQRLLAQLLRAGDFAAVRKLADWRISVKPEIAAAAWEDERITVEWTAETGPGALVVVDGERRLLRRHGIDDLDVTSDLAKTTWDVVLVELTRGEVIVPTKATTTVRPDGRVAARGTAVIGFTGGADALADGWWQIRLRVRTLGWVAESPLRPSAWPVAASFVRRPVTLVRADRTQLGAPCVEVGGSVPWLDAAFAMRTTAEITGAVLTLQLPARSVEPLALELRVGGQVLAVEGRPTGPATTTVTVDLGAAGAAPTGALRLDLPGGRGVPLAMAVTSVDGRLVLRRPMAARARLRAVAVRRAAVRVVNSSRARSMRLARRVRRLVR
jgi:glycosyltransferase involved in cell wall biosynthesis